jgi:ribosomal protein S18 acetylase RimI-like enzyme
MQHENALRTIRTLGDLPLERIRVAFIDAFSDYEVQINMPMEKFLGMIRTRDLDLSRSIGYFEGDTLVGFILVGCRHLMGCEYWYDGGTGIIQENRRQGIGTLMLQNLLARMKTEMVSGFVLEVLEHNAPAIALYAKHGFTIQRRLRCFRIHKQNLALGPENPLDCASLTRSDDIGLYADIHIDRYLAFPPSWQNAGESIKNSLHDYAFTALLDAKGVVGYGLIHKVSGDVPQLGVLPAWRGKKVEPLLLAQLGRQCQGDRLTLLNADEQDPLCGVLSELGFENFINQYEMSIGDGLPDFPDCQTCLAEENSHRLRESMVSSRK